MCVKNIDPFLIKINTNFSDINLPLDYQCIFIPFTHQIYLDKLKSVVVQQIMQKQSGYLFDQELLDNKLRLQKEQVKNSKDELAIELLKLKGEEKNNFFNFI